MGNSSSITGKRVAVIWKKQGGTIVGGTEGLALGVVGDKESGGFLVIDRSTYESSLKSAFFSLGLLDLRIVPVDEIESLRRFDLRKRSPGVCEEFSWYIRIDFKSNIDYSSTETKMNRSGLLVKPNLPIQTEQPCQIVIPINGIDGATVNISPAGTVQIFCSPLRLNDCISWLQNSVEIMPDHKRLVLIPTDFQFTIQDGYRLSAKPAEEIIDRLGKTEGDQPVLFPLGWIHKFFAELDKNPLQDLFSDSEFSREKVLVPRSKRKKKKPKVKANSLRPIQRN